MRVQFYTPISRLKTLVWHCAVGVTGFLKSLWNRINRDDCKGLAAEMAYNLFLSFIPGFIFLFSLLGVLGKQMELMPIALNYIDQLAPPQANALLKETLIGVLKGSSNQLTIIGFAIALWSASSTAAVLIKGLSRAYGIPMGTYSFLSLPFLSVGIVASLGVMVLIAANFIVFGVYIIHWLDQWLQLSQYQYLSLHYLRWLVSIAGITLLTTYIYALILQRKKQSWDWRSSLTGAVVFVMLWITLSLLFSTYVCHFQQWNPVYGMLGTIILLLIWLYVSSFAMLIGGEVTAIMGLPEAGNPDAPTEERELLHTF